ncbi:MAG TPA: hypothetical protein VMK53_10780 [Gemmatimonadales bacterium]|nr:hypothetical protein [Gemmatimonadales bacterium]
MPPVTRWFLRSGMLCLLAGLLGLTVLAARPVLGGPSWLGALWPTLLHLLVMGWITQLIFGVSHWMFPRHTAVAPRGSEQLMWVTWVTLNAGLLLRVIGEPRAILGHEAAGLLLSSAVLQLLAALAFVANLWRRVKVR